ncbi:MAG: nucleotidyltransferase family protein [Bacteroidetes bacterium]|nr:nucleotidyltransferase family protein [Bacteroidota bacterium]
MKTDLTVEQNLLLRCCQNQLAPDADTLSSFFAKHTPDFSRFIELTTKHRLFPVVNMAVRSQRQAVPLEIMSEVARVAGRNLKRMMNLAGELGVVHQLFAKSGIEFIAVKGPVMVQQLYGDYHCRQTRDLDLLVEEKNIDRAISVLTRAGYIFLDAYFLKNPGKRQLYLKRENHVRFRHPDKMIFIELHWSVSKYFTTIQTEHLFENSIEIEIQGKVFRTFSLEDYFVILATHGVYHRYELLFWLYDIAYILNLPGTDLRNLLTNAEKFNCATAVKVSMALALTIFKLETIDNRGQSLKLSLREKFIFDQCFNVIFNQKSNPGGHRLKKLLDSVLIRISRQAYLLLMTNDWNSRKRVLLNMLIKPYVWSDEAKIPLNNLIYLFMTQVKWVGLTLSGRMGRRGKISGKELTPKRERKKV